MGNLVVGIVLVGAISRWLVPVIGPPLLGLRWVGRPGTSLVPDASLHFDGNSLDRVELLLPPYIAEPLTVQAADLTNGALCGQLDENGSGVYGMIISEEDFNTLFASRFQQALSAKYRNLEIELLPGGLALMADVKLGIYWQRLGLLLQPAGCPLYFVPAGLIVSDTLYKLPTDGALANWANTMAFRATDTFQHFALVGPLPGEAHVRQAAFFPDRVELAFSSIATKPRIPDTGWQLIEAGLSLRQMDAPVGAAYERVTMIRLDPQHFTIRVHYSPDHLRTIHQWAEELQPLLLINAGYFERSGETIGTLVSDGVVAGDSYGDYAGMFTASADGQVGIRWLRQYPFEPDEGLWQGVQSFPLLVKPGGEIGFTPENDNGRWGRRTIVALDEEGQLLLIVAEDGFHTLSDIARFLVAADMDIDVALNLDGGTSTGLWLNTRETQICIDSVVPIPSVISIRSR